jgi:KipI family sensor histidine kinase inhibitor
MIPNTHWLGDCAVIVEVADGDEREAVAAALASALPAVWVRRGLREVLVESLRPRSDLRERVIEALHAVDGSFSARSVDAAIVTIEVEYSGADLADVAAVLGVSSGDVVRAHQQQEWRVAMVGFAPGFGYLEPVGTSALDWSVLARRSSPRPCVPAGSVAVAAGMSAVYPQQMPGGWHLIGSTHQVMFDVEVTDRPALLAPGNRVRFTRLGQGL